MSTPFAPRDLPARLRACQTSQERVRVTMAAFGGYWRPLAAVARLLEELGELSEELAAEPAAAREPSHRAPVELGAELADLWIITAALADQYLAEVAEPGSAGSAAPSHSIGPLLAAAGQIARIVNHYDGPKRPRGGEEWISIGSAVARFHAELSELAGALGVDLRAAVRRKLRAIPTLDSGRFSTAWHDPATAACLEEFRRLPDVAGSALAAARLWGAADWRRGSIAANAQAMAPSLRSFSKASRSERLHCFVIPGPRPAQRRSPPGAGEAWMRELAEEIGAADADLRRLAETATLHAPADGPRAHGRFFACLHAAAAT